MHIIHIYFLLVHDSVYSRLEVHKKTYITTKESSRSFHLTSIGTFQISAERNKKKILVKRSKKNLFQVYNVFFYYHEMIYTKIVSFLNESIENFGFSHLDHYPISSSSIPHIIFHKTFRLFHTQPQLFDLWHTPKPEKMRWDERKKNTWQNYLCWPRASSFSHLSLKGERANVPRTIWSGTRWTSQFEHPAMLKLNMLKVIMLKVIMLKINMLKGKHIQLFN